jgi:hypothetical protein
VTLEIDFEISKFMNTISKKYIF